MRIRRRSVICEEEEEEEEEEEGGTQEEIYGCIRLYFMSFSHFDFYPSHSKQKKEKTRKRCMRVEEPKRRIKEEIVTGEENSKF